MYRYSKMLFLRCVPDKDLGMFDPIVKEIHGWHMLNEIATQLETKID